MASSNEEFRIDGRSVTQTHFEKFIAPMKEVEGTRYLKETISGNITGYVLMNKRGRKYQYRSELRDDKCIRTLKTKNGD